MFLPLLISFLAMLFIVQAPQSRKSTRYDARISTEVVSGKLLISNVFENNGSEIVNLTFRFKCKRSSRAGSSVSSQSGSFKAAPGQSVLLSETSVSYAPSDALTLTLDVLEAGVIVASANYSSGEE